MINTIAEYVAGIFLLTYVVLFLGALALEVVSDLKYWKAKYFKKS